MALPTLEKTWQFNVNQAIATTGVVNTDAQNLLFRIKQTLIGFSSNPWTVVRSSNSVTTGASDLWVAASNLIFNNGSSHSWIILQQTGVTGGPAQICLDCNSNQYSNFSLILSPAAGFVTGGTTTARPTASDESFLLNNSQYVSSSAVSSVVHAMMSSSGDSTRILTFQGGVLGLCFMIESLSDSILTNKTVGFCKYGVTTVSTYYNYATLGGRFGSTVCSAFMGTEVYNAIPIATANSGAISNITGAYPIAAISAHSETIGCKGRLGRFSDLWFGSSGVATGSTYPTSPNDKEFLHVNPFVIPWNGSIPLLT